MKKFYVLGLSLSASFVLSQEVISFEAEEGYELGTIHNQQGWTVTEGIDGLLENQIITDELATEENSFSFKNAHETDFDYQWFPIFGASKMFNESYKTEGFSITYDVMVTELMGADFEFTIYYQDEVEDFYPIGGVGMEYQGGLYVINSLDYDYETIDSVEWTPNTWYTIKIEVNPTEVKYYFDGELIFTGENYNPTNIAGFNMLHNNYGGSAFYDNFIIEGQVSTAGLNEIAKTAAKLYPNPVKDVLTISLTNNEEVSSVEIFNVSGQKVKSTQNVSKLMISELAKGIYVLKVQTKSGKIVTEKFIKN